MIRSGIKICVTLIACLVGLSAYSQDCPNIVYPNGCDDVDWMPEISIGSDLSTSNGVQFCVPVTVSNFQELSSLQLTITWDPSIFTFDDKVITMNLPNFDANDCNVTSVLDGNLSMVWINDDFTGVCLPDETVIFSLCFIPIGDPGDLSGIAITNNLSEALVAVSINDEDIAQADICEMDLIGNPGVMQIGCNSLFINAGSCSTPTGSTNGAINFFFCGGTPPYSWDITETTDSGVSNMDNELVIISGLGTGSYTVNVADDTGASTSATVQVLNAQEMVLVLDGTDPTCLDRNNGEVWLEPIAGGVPAYHEAWSNFEFSTMNIDDLEAGTYTVTVNDAFGCVAIDSFTLNLDTLKITATLVDSVSCPGATDGQVFLQAEGGIPGYEFMLPGGDVGPLSSVDDIAVDTGWYIFHVEDESFPKCTTDLDSLYIPYKTMITVDVQVEDIQCHGSCDGMVTVCPAGGTVYSYRLRNDVGMLITGGTNTPTKYWHDALCAGTYIIEVEDISSNCMVTQEFTITEPDTFYVDTVVMQQSCTGNDASIVLDPIGGSPGYTYLWDDGNMDKDRTGLGGGMYEATVTDLNGCQDSIKVTIDNVQILDVEVMIIQEPSCDCGGLMRGDVVSGGTGFIYQWYTYDADDGDPTNDTPYSTFNIVGGVCPGNYYLIVEDTNNGCFSEPDTINMPSGGDITLGATAILPTCVGDTNGTIIIQVTNGGPDIIFDWEDFPQNTPVQSLLSAGTYCVTVLDGMCTADTCIVLMDPPPVLIDTISTQSATCVGSATGCVTVIGSGGLLGGNVFFYDIYDANVDTLELSRQDSDTIELCGLEPGNYEAFASDGQCISESLAFSISAPEAITLLGSSTNVQDVTCYGVCDGTATVAATGGSGDYTYFWPDLGETGSSVIDLCPGWNVVQISDNEGCMTMDSVEVGQPDTLIAFIDPFSTVNLSCSGANTGIITVSHTGGNIGDFDYTWTGNVSDTNVAQNLGQGTYEITVTDTEGCTDSISYTMISPPILTAIIPDPPEPDCFGGQTCITVESVTGGSGGIYTFTINQNQERYPLDTCINVFAGVKNITVFDGSGCSIEQEIIIDQPFELTVDLGPDFEVDLGDDNETLEAIINSQLPIDSIFWSPEEQVSCEGENCEVVYIFPTQTTDYSVTVMDENGCLTSDDITVRIDENRNIYIPNIFSPNGSSGNDVFKVYAGDGVEMIETTQIYDRWGNLVFSADNIAPNPAGAPEWNGSFKGEPLNSGVFVYLVKVKFIDGRTIDYSGDITLLR